MNAVARLVAMHALPAYADGVEGLAGWLDGLGEPGCSSAIPGRPSSGAGSTRSADTPSRLPSGSKRRRAAGEQSIGPQVALLRAAFCRSGPDQMLADAETAASALTWTSRWRPTAVLLCGVAHLLRGENDRADALFAHADEVAAGVGAVDVRRLALAQRSLLAESAGDRPRAQELAGAVGSARRNERPRAVRAGRDRARGDCTRRAPTRRLAGRSRGARRRAGARARVDARTSVVLGPGVDRARPWVHRTPRHVDRDESAPTAPGRSSSSDRRSASWCRRGSRSSESLPGCASMASDGRRC